MFFRIFLLKTRSKLSGNVDESRGLRFRWSHVVRPLKCDDIAILVPCAVACKRTAFTEIIYSNRLWYETPGHPLRHPLKGDYEWEQSGNLSDIIIKKFQWQVKTKKKLRRIS